MKSAIVRLHLPGSKYKTSTLEVRPARIQGEVRVPGDKSISHRALILAALADGVTRITNFLPGEDCLCTLRALQALGCHMEMEGKTTVIVHGTAGKLRPACEPLDCGNSGTAMRLLAGVLASYPFKSKLTGDRSLSERPMRRIVDPLTLMGGKITAEGEKQTPPLRIEGATLQGIEYTLPVASAQLKSCLLLAGLNARGITTVIEKAPSRDHTERLLEHFHVPMERDGNRITVKGGSRLHAKDLFVPGDFSSAAFWIVAAAVSPGARLTVADVGLNPTRTGLMSVLLRMGGMSFGGLSMAENSLFRESVNADCAEPYGTLTVVGRAMRGTRIEGDEIPNVIDELPILAVAGALAQGETVIADAHELRYKETDRISAMAENLRAFGVTVTETDDGMVIEGGAPIKGAEVKSYGDHRIAMACAVLALFAQGPSTIEDVDCVATSYPTFVDDLKALTVLTPGGMVKNTAAPKPAATTNN
jgi:3-phosphoshikimate 1-carboxyvinyltransferase